MRVRLAAAEAAETEGRPAEASVLLGDALALWLGPALTDLRSLPALERVARQIDERRISICERRLELELGRLSSLIGEIYGLIESYPLWENLYYYLMISLYETGRTADSLRAYQLLREALIDTLGMEPSTHLQHLHHAVLAREHWLDNARTASLQVSKSA